MIGYLRGSVRKKSSKDIIVETSGVGYRILVHDRFRESLAEGELVELWTYLAVREDALTLYGFESETQFELFETLLLVSGIGPKSAMAITGSADPSAMRHAIALGDTAYLTKISGIGRKNAEKIVLELRDKFHDLPSSDSSYAGKTEREALEALETLGYSIRDIRDVVHSVARNHSDPKSIISESLKALGKR